MRRHVRRALAILAALLALGLVILWLWPMPPSGADISVLSPETAAEAEALHEEIDAYIRAVEEQYARAVSHRRVLTVLAIIGISASLLARRVLGRVEPS